eukprot:753677-Hanusia_phi.AAC.2
MNQLSVVMSEDASDIDTCDTRRHQQPPPPPPPPPASDPAAAAAAANGGGGGGAAAALATPFLNLRVLVLVLVSSPVV